MTTASGALSGPRLGRDFDHRSGQCVAEPVPIWKRLRAEEPVARSERHGGYYVLTRYQDVYDAARATDVFSSSCGTGIPALPVVGMIPIDIDPPDQREYRRILNPSLTPAKVAVREPELRALAARLIEPLEDVHEFDLCASFTIPYPPAATLNLIGFPAEEHDELAEAVEIMSRRDEGNLEQSESAGARMAQRSAALVARRRSAPREDDLLDALLVGSFQGRPLTDQEVLSTLSILLFGAVDTTANAVAGAMYYFAGRPRDQARFRETGFDMIALDEIVRWTSPVQGIGRILKKDTEVAGCPMKAGEWVHLSFGSGNYDDTVFPEPETMDFERKPNPHLGFGMGPHRCVGAHLGKLMLKVALEELLRRLGPVRLGDPAEIQWVGGETRGLRRLPLVRG